jgi:hypothetical protein
MRKFFITSKAGVEYGIYEGRTEAEALCSLHREAGYSGVKYDAEDDWIEWPNDETERLCGDVDAWTIEDITNTPPDTIISQASELAYEEDAYQIVGQDNSGEWVIRHIEDPTETTLRNRVKVGVSGIVE